MKASKKIAFSAILSALAVIFLLIGSIIETVTFSASAIASLFVVVAVCELGYYYSASVWMIASTLGFLLLPVKDPVFYFACFFGFYPILKSLIERIKSKVSYLIKAVVFSVSYIVISFLAIKLFVPEANLTLILIIAYPILMLVFFAFDYALTKLINYYFKSLRKRLGIDKYLH